MMKNLPSDKKMYQDTIKHTIIIQNILVFYKGGGGGKVWPIWHRT